MPSPNQLVNDVIRRQWRAPLSPSVTPRGGGQPPPARGNAGAGTGTQQPQAPDMNALIRRGGR